ncbi:MAG: carbamoyl phosphate synthase small subunit [SAR116 cluster bacterium]|nr:carbamoyl phosphate synthase small subunit [SAR116 cluster bacterium]
MKKNNNSAILIFENGDIFFGFGFGATGQKIGEVCFNTSMTGYQEIITDPSYNKQLINFTFPHLGNVGTNSNDNEANLSYASGIITREPPSQSSNWRSEYDFNKWLELKDVIGIYGIDTRQLTKYIKDNNAPMGLICYDKTRKFDFPSLQDKLSKHPKLKGSDLVPNVSTKSIFDWQDRTLNVISRRDKIKKNNNNIHVVALDFGIKQNILRCLKDIEVKVTIVPFNYDFERIKALRPDGIFLSNGPGDPLATYNSIKNNFDKILTMNIPIFGICIGHQLLALACGAKTKKMTQGHRGGNHPVFNLMNGNVEITSQNHGFNVIEASLPKDLLVTHKSLFDDTIEGLEHVSKPIFSVQYHPEASPGPHDSKYLFEKFYKYMI